MICFEIFVNGEKKCTAGVSAENHSEPSKWQTLQAMVCLSRSDPDSLKRLFGEDDPDLWKNGHPELTVYGRVGAVRDIKAECWAQGVVLAVGDEVTIRIIDSEEVDFPETKYDLKLNMWTPAEAAKSKEFRQKLYEKLKQEFS